MDECEWMETVNLTAMLNHLPGSRRKERLALAALARRALGTDDARAREAIEFAEQFADGQVDPSQCEVIGDWLPTSSVSDPLTDREQVIDYLVHRMELPSEFIQVYRWAEDQFENALSALRMVDYDRNRDLAERRAWEDRINREQADMLREVFGNPLRPVSLNPA